VERLAPGRTIEFGRRAEPDRLVLGDARAAAAQAAAGSLAAIYVDPPFGTGTIRRGRGLAVAIKAVISPTTSVANVNIAGDGSTTLYCGTVDMGQGSTTAMAQIAAETLGLEAEAVRVVAPDTDVTPYDMGTLGSRSTFHMGHAVRLAAEDAKAKLAALAAETGVPSGTNLPIAELFRRKYGMQAGTVVGSGSYMPSYVAPDHATGQTPNATPFWMVGGSAAEIEIDTETGQIRVLRLVTVAHAGTPVNPKIVETQLTGAAIQHLGMTFFENMEFTDGQLRNPNFAEYKIPGIRDLPEQLSGEIVDAVQQSGPYGAKGVGETGTFAVAPAIANAIHDAVGVRLMKLPITPLAILTGVILTVQAAVAQTQNVILFVPDGLRALSVTPPKFTRT
jgi:CO/xanthine dehydrogenase Mo-binding subunit